MRKWLFMLGLVLCLCACHSTGSLEAGNLNLEMVKEQMDEYIEDGVWQMSVLQDPMDAKQVESVYGITSDMVEESLARSSLVSIACDEVAIFHAINGQEDAIEEALQNYLNNRIQEYSLLPEQIAILNKAQILKIGSYVIFVCGNDQANVIQYISSLS